MNQTEIPKNCLNHENENTLNLRDRSISKPTSRITVIKANVYENFKDYTPRVQQSDKNSSSGKLIRVSSSKGINVTSSRPTSCEKQTKQFSATGTSFHGGLDSTAKREEYNLLAQMREQLKKTTQIYENKMNQQLSYQYNYMSLEIDRLKEINKTNQAKLLSQKLQIDTLQKRISEVDNKTNQKMEKLQEQLRQFKNYYEKCYEYSVSRVNDVDTRMKTLYTLIESETCPVKASQACQEVHRANKILQRMSNVFIDKTYMLRAEIKKQLYDLEVMIGSCSLRVDDIDELSHNLKLIGYKNEAFCETLKQCIHSNTKLSASKTSYLNNHDSSEQKYNIAIRTQELYNSILKRLKACEIQIQMIFCMQNSEQQEKSAKNSFQQQQIQQMKKIIDTLDKKIEEDKIWYLKQIKDKQQLSARVNPRVIELEQRLKAAYQLQAHLHKEVSQQNLKIAFLQTKCSKLNEREFKTQSTLAEAFSQALLKEKSKQFEQEKHKYLQKIRELQEKVRDMDHENYLLAEKYSQFQNDKQQINKLTSQISFLTKLTSEYQTEKDTFLDQINSLKKQIVKLEKLNEQIKQQNEILLQNKKHISEQDELYIDELQEEVQKNMNIIKSLQLDNQNLMNKNKELEEENKNLQKNLHLYAETFQKQSINFRKAIEKLQKQKDYHVSENRILKQENSILKQDLEMSKSCHSFYETSEVSLRKSHSTQLSSPKTMKKSQNRPKKVGQNMNNLLKLSKAIKDLQLPLPVLCEIDETGYLKLESTSTYVLDSNDNLFRLTEQEMKEAISMGLILV